MVRAIDPDLPISDVRTMEDHMGIALLPARLGGWVLGLFGLLGLTLAAAVILRDVDTAFGERWPVSVLSLITALFLFVTHRSNIRKMFRSGSKGVSV